MVEKKSEAAGDLKTVFGNFAGGKPQMDGKTFFKMFKDGGLVDKKLDQTSIDIIFTKHAEKGVKKMNYSQFAAALAECAAKKGITPADMEAKVKALGGPSFKGTKADSVKWHDDKSLYTGVYAKGGPTNVDKDKITSISKTCDRTAADVRGVKK